MQDFESIKKIINQSQILPASEKAEWLQLLPSMNDLQRSELIKILKQPAVIPSVPLAVTKPIYAQVVNQPAAQKLPDYKEKEISTSKPLYELEIPDHAHIFKPPVPVAPIAPLKNPEANTFKKAAYASEEKISQSAHVGIPASAPMPSSSAVKPVSLTAILAAQQHAREVLQSPSFLQIPVKVFTSKAPELILNTPEDFAKIRTDFLHGHDPVSALQSLMQTLVRISQPNRFFLVMDSFEKSPLYKSYIMTGLALLNDLSPDREAAYAVLTASSTVQNKSYLNKEEMEAFADFRKELDRLYL